MTNFNKKNYALEYITLTQAWKIMVDSFNRYGDNISAKNLLKVPTGIKLNDNEKQVIRKLSELGYIKQNGFCNYGTCIVYAKAK